MDLLPWRDDFALPNAAVSIIRSAFTAPLVDVYFRAIDVGTVWRRDKVMMFGREVNIPRLQAWFGDATYTYSGIRMKPEPFGFGHLWEIKRKVEALTGHSFNSCLANYYRDGNDHVSWHADDEPELGEAPVIASVSLGAARDFQLRPVNAPREVVTIELNPGSLLLMAGGTQRYWQHRLPKRKGAGPRINLTFRNIVG